MPRTPQYYLGNLSTNMAGRDSAARHWCFTLNSTPNSTADALLCNKFYFLYPPETLRPVLNTFLYVVIITFALHFLQYAIFPPREPMTIPIRCG